MSRKSNRASKKRKVSGRRRQSLSQSQQKSALTFSIRLWWWIGGAAVALLLGAVALWFTVGPGKPASPEPAEEASTSVLMPTNPAERIGMYSAPPEMQIDPSKTYIATFETEKGDIVVELFASKAPKTVNNFVFLARQGFYDNTTFHRVIPDFMAQAGDPTGTGGGGPGYAFSDEFHPDLRHERPGTLSMANAGANTNGSQFFITYKPTTWLDAYDENGDLRDCARPDVSCHAVFGQVIEGMDVLESLTPRDPQSPTSPGDLIKAIRIEER